MRKDSYTMNENINEENIWYLKKMLEVSEKDFAEGRYYTHEQVKNMLKNRTHADKMVSACV